MSDSENTVDKVIGSAKEAVGSAIGDEDLEKEGQHQQEAAEKDEEAEELRQEAEAKEKQSEGHEGAAESR